MPDEQHSFERERCELIARRVPTFALGWVGTMTIWLVVFAAEGRLSGAAAALFAATVVVLAVTHALVRSDPTAARVPAVVVVSVGILGVLAIALVETVGAYAEVLAFLLLTLYLLAALLFAWGWRAALALLAATLLPWLARVDALERFVPWQELVAAVTIGASLALGVAEASARNIRQVWRRRRAERQATAALRSSRDAYRDLAERAPDMIWSSDLAGRLTYVNQALTRFLGLPAEAILGRSGTEFWTQHAENPDRAALLATDSAEPAPPTEIQCATPRGPRWVEVALSVDRDDAGRPVGFRGISRDVHERRVSQEALRTSEARYRGLVESQLEMVVRLDAGGRYVFVNDAYAAKCGSTREELLGRTFMERVHPDDHAALADAIAAMMRPPHRVLVEIRNLTVDGVRWVAWEGVVVMDAAGCMLEAQAVGRDVTARREAEANLRESEERFRRAFDDAAIGMALTTTDGRTVRVNPALCAMLGYDEAELLTRSIEDVVHPDDRGPLEGDRARLAAGGVPFYRAERRYRHRDGGLLWVQVTASLVRDAGGVPRYFLAQIQDITERRVAEDALRDSIVDLRRSEEKLRLLAQRQVTIREEERKRVGLDLHDDVCQELVGVGILVESLRRKLTPMSADVAADFGRVVRYLGEVVEHLRLLARELRPLLLHDLGLDGGLRSLADGMSSPTLAVRVDFQTAVPRLDEEVELGVHRIAQEAVANAVRHAEARSIVISLAAVDGVLTVTIRDDGRGFDPEARRAAALGLASMEERALALGGGLEIRSGAGRGTTVTLRCSLAVGASRLRELAGSSPTRSSSPLSTTTTPRSAARD